MTAAAAGRTQLRGSRIAESSQVSSSSWASSVRLTSVELEPLREVGGRVDRRQRLAQQGLEIGGAGAHRYSVS